jgi:hypothetical protein
VAHQTFSIEASAPSWLLPHKAPSAEFAPDPALDPLWISSKTGRGYCGVAASRILNRF